jgi:hypothetical protein
MTTRTECPAGQHWQSLVRYREHLPRHRCSNHPYVERIFFVFFRALTSANTRAWAALADLSDDIVHVSDASAMTNQTRALLQFFVHVTQIHSARIFGSLFFTYSLRVECQIRSNYEWHLLQSLSCDRILSPLTSPNYVRLNTHRCGRQIGLAGNKLSPTRSRLSRSDLYQREVQETRLQV